MEIDMCFTLGARDVEIDHALLQESVEGKMADLIATLKQSKIDSGEQLQSLTQRMVDESKQRENAEERALLYHKAMAEAHTKSQVEADSMHVKVLSLKLSTSR